MELLRKVFVSRCVPSHAIFAKLFISQPQRFRHTQIASTKYVILILLFPRRVLRAVQQEDSAVLCLLAFTQIESQPPMDGGARQNKAEPAGFCLLARATSRWHGFWFDAWLLPLAYEVTHGKVLHANTNGV